MTSLREWPCTVEDLHQLVRLDPDSGRIYWRERSQRFFKTGACSIDQECKRWNKRHAGKEALTSVHRKGFRHGFILGVQVKSHCVAFALANDRWPEGQVDHRDTDQGNNRPNNLREATNQQNSFNRRSHKDSTSSFKGVSRRPSGRWVAQIMRDGRQFYLGIFDSEQAAAQAYDVAAAQKFGDFARLNFSTGDRQ